MDQALGLRSDQVLLRSAFGGGQVGGDVFVGGQVVLWPSEPHTYTVAAALDLGNGHWTGTNSLTTVAVPPEGPFYTLAVVNPPWDRDRELLIQALFGRITDARAARLEVQLADGNVLASAVRDGLWLAAVTSPDPLDLRGAVLRLFDERGNLLREGPLAQEKEKVQGADAP